VIHDLETFGEVRDYERHPNKEEGEASFQSAMKGHSEISAGATNKEGEKEEKGKEKEAEKVYTVSAVEKAFDAWLENNMAEEQLVWLGEEKDKVSLGLGEDEFNLVFPRKGVSNTFILLRFFILFICLTNYFSFPLSFFKKGASTFSVTGKKAPWVNDFNEHFEKEKDVELSEVFTKLQDIIEASKRLKNKRKIALTQSTDSNDG